VQGGNLVVEGIAALVETAGVDAEYFGQKSWVIWPVLRASAAVRVCSSRLRKRRASPSA
jgi:hypothetical protein